ncbi:hypothetical protein CCP3SC1_110005 [Gammaproteobacteria bacterium]
MVLDIGLDCREISSDQLRLFLGNFISPNLMGKHYLTSLFSPKSVAVFGASDRSESVGGIVYQNLIAGFHGPVYGINPRRPVIGEKPMFASIEEVTQPVDLAVITAPLPAIAAIIESCGKQGIKSAVVLSPGFREIRSKNTSLQRVIIQTAKQYGVRLLGPNCFGIMRPEIGLNATFYRGGGASRPAGLGFSV